MLRSRSLGTIVGAGFASLLVMLAALIALSIREVDIAHEQRLEITTALQMAEAADRLALQVTLADSALRDSILSRDPRDRQAARQRRETARQAAAELQDLQPREPEGRRLADLVLQAAARWNRQAIDAEAVAERLQPGDLVHFQRQYLAGPTTEVVTAVESLRERLTRDVQVIRDRLSQRGDRLTDALIVGFALAGVAGILLGVYFVRLVTEPVARLVAVADAVSAGDYPAARQHVAEASGPESRSAGNEILRLTLTLAQMAATLEEREQHLRSHAAHLAVVNQVLASLQSLTDASLTELELHELIEQLLQRLVKGLEAESGVVFLESPVSARLEPRISAGLDDAGMEPGSASASEFARKVAEDGQLVTVTDLTADAVWKETFPTERGARAFIGVPFRAGDRAAGVAYVGFREPRTFDAPQLHLVRTFGERIERAIERAHSMESAAAWQRDLERQVAQQQDQLVRSERLASIGLVGESIAHELRNPLGVISNSIYFLRHRLQPTDEKVQRHLEIIAMEVDQAKRIINNLVDFSTSIEPVTTRVALNSLIEAALERLRVPPQVHVELDLHEPLPPLLGDEAQLLQVFEHLIRNAIQAVEDGGRIRIVTESDGARVRVAVNDSGAGVPTEDQQRIFEPLVTTRVKGMGLGLTFSRRIVEAHGGEIGLVSEPGQGSTFTVDLPVSEPATPAPSGRLADTTQAKAD